MANGSFTGVGITRNPATGNRDVRSMVITSMEMYHTRMIGQDLAKAIAQIKAVQVCNGKRGRALKKGSPH